MKMCLKDIHSALQADGATETQYHGPILALNISGIIIPIRIATSIIN